MGPSVATTGAVYNNTLTYQRDGGEVAVEVGSREWYGWLDTATSFAFSGVEGTFTAHKERASNRRGGWYWRAYRQRRGRLLRFYLGVSARVTPERLHAAASRLASSDEESSASEEKASPAASGTLPDMFKAPSLLTTRLQIPRLPLLHVPRPRAVELLEQSVRHGLTLVCAPAGSGKTTLLAEWAVLTSLPVAWLSLEGSENDPARFFAYLSVALTCLDRPPSSPGRLELPSYTPNHERAMTGMLNDLERLLRRDAVLVLDDYHLITSAAVHEMLHFFLDHRPARLYVVIGSRIDPPLPLARLRARGQLSELRAEELRFVSAEVKAFVRAMGCVLSDEATDLLERRTEGWIAGIQLLALALRGHSDAIAFLCASGGTHRFLLDYLSEEVLAQQTPETQRFLLRTSILERLCGPLCDAVTGQKDGHERLTELQHSNLFVSALDDAETWYRYHPLFAEALRAHLQKQEPALLAELYSRASYWYEQHQDRETACDYAFQAANYPRAAQLLGELLVHLMEQGRVERLKQWMDQLPAALIAASPQLSIASIWMRLLHRQSLDSIEETLRDLEQNMERQMREHALDAANPWVELQGELTLFRAAFAFFENDLPLTRTLLQEASQALSTHKTGLGRLIFFQLQMLLSLTYRASGDLETAEKLLLAICTHGVGEAYSPLGLIAVWSLAGLYEAQGRLRAREQLYAKISQEFESITNMPPLPLSMLQVSRAALLYEWNRLPEATELLQQALLVIQDLGVVALSAFSVMSAFSKFSFWLQARLELVQGNTQAARDILQRMESSNIVQAQLVERTPLGASRARLALALNQMDEACDWERTSGKRFDGILEPSMESAAFFDYTTLARVLIARGRVQHSETALAQALTLLANLRDFATRMDFRGWLIEIQMLTALTLQVQGKIKQALITLGAILAEPEPEGYIRLFADEGRPMEALFAQVAPYTSASRAYLQALQAACLSTPAESAASQPEIEPRQVLVDPLSKREQEVLALLAAGLSNQQIADQLVISLNTAKRHVKHILAKLAAANRTAAVTRARELCLI